MKKNSATELNEISREGFEALVDRLGMADALRFIQFCGGGRGDYTRDRHKWLDQLSIEDIVARIEARRNVAVGRRGSARTRRPKGRTPKLARSRT